MTGTDPFEGLGDLPVKVNIASLLPRAAAEWPEQPAVVAAATGTSASFAELELRSNRMAGGLAGAGVARGDRVCLFVTPGVELIALTYALFKLGAVPVLADPGMGRKRLLACMESMRPRVFIGIPRAQAVRKLFPASFESVEISVTVGRRLFWGGESLATLEARASGTFQCAATSHDEPAAILFTSGSTGPPKGVLHTHGTLHAQVLALRALYGFEPGEVDLACFPLFALFDVAFGMTSVFPDMDVSRPAACDPSLLVAAAQKYGATTAFGSPAIWKRVAPWCMDNGQRLGPMRRVLIAGAPVSTDLIKSLHDILPLDGDVHTPYGATECLPVTSIAGHEVLPGLRKRVESGAGTCVGVSAAGIDLRVIEVRDAPIEHWSDDLELEPGSVGEVVVRGPVVTTQYAEEPQASALAKIRHPDGSIWHRLGDLGYLDPEGRLWFCGRKSHRLETAQGMRPCVPAENVFNTHPRVARTALVGVGPRGEEQPTLWVEPLPGQLPTGKVMTEGFCMQLKTIGKKHAVSANIEDFLFHPSFPVDVRHEAKIHREELKRLAEEQLR